MNTCLVDRVAIVSFSGTERKYGDGGGWLWALLIFLTDALAALRVVLEEHGIA